MLFLSPLRPRLLYNIRPHPTPTSLYLVLFLSPLGPPLRPRLLYNIRPHPLHYTWCSFSLPRPSLKAPPPPSRTPVSGRPLPPAPGGSRQGAPPPPSRVDPPPPSRVDPPPPPPTRVDPNHTDAGSKGRPLPPPNNRNSIAEESRNVSTSSLRSVRGKTSTS